jgi:hypothetical protein
MLESEEKGAMLFAEPGLFIARKLRCPAIAVMADGGAKLLRSYPQQNLKLGGAGRCRVF